MSQTPRRLALTPAETERCTEVARLRAAGADGVAPLLAMLTDPSWAVRREVVAALGAAGDAAVAPLCEILRTRRDDETRLAAAVDALVASTADVLETVSALASSHQPAVVADAAQILGRRRNPRATPLLARLAGHPDDNVAVSAIEALGRVGGRAAVDALLAAVSSGSFFRVFPAIDVLGRSGDPRAVPALAALLQQPTYALEAARALGRGADASAVAPLARLLVLQSEGAVRVAASSIAEVAARHRARYGSDQGVADALRRANPGDAAVRQLVHSLAAAEEEERIAIAWLLGVLGGERAAGALGRLLDAGGGVSQAAAAALVETGPDADRDLRAALREGPSARRAVLLPLVSRSSASAEVRLCLDDPDPTVRALACEALARLGAVGAVPKLFELLGDADPRVSNGAVAAIQALGSIETRDLALRAAESGDPAARRNAVRILGYFGFDGVLPTFLAALTQDADPRLQEIAVAGLPFLDEARALETLLGVARDPSGRLRGAAMRALGHTPSTDPRIVATLLAALDDREPWVRYYAAQALGRVGASSATGALAALLDDPAGQVRVAAVEALSHFDSPTAVDALRRAAEQGDADLQRAALIGLGIARRPEAARVLESAIAAPDAATRLVALSAFVDSSSPGAVPVLARAARDADENVRAAAVGFLGAIPAREATEALVELAAEGTERDRVLAVLAQPVRGRIEGVRAALDEAGDELASLLASALARLRSAEALRALVSALGEAPVPARKAAASALAAVGTQQALQAIRSAAETDPELEVRQICAVLLAD